MELTAIDVTRAELNERLTHLQHGITLLEVRRWLGGSEFKTEGQNSFWRFRVTDAAYAHDPYEIYMGTFDEGKLTTGAMLPRG